MTTKPHVFGHLYMAVFSNGTVKAGMSKRDPQSRVTAHAHAGRAFGISMDATFFATIYTNDVKARERHMHAAIGSAATPTSGREWFKFASSDDALNFASAYLHKIEKMSFVERPSHEEVRHNLEKKCHSLDRVVQHFDEQKRLSEASNVCELLDGLNPGAVIAIAEKIIFLEDWMTLNSDRCDTSMPILACAIDKHTISGEMDINAAKEVISAAAMYRDFFIKACSVKLAQSEEVSA